MAKPLNAAPKRLQRMFLRLQKFSLYVNYKKGKHMYLADTLSRAPVEEVQTCSFAKELEKVDHQQSLPIGNPRWIQLKEASADVLC